MPKDLLFVTGNPHKVEELMQIVNGKFNIRSLKDIGFSEEIPETSDTIRGNAIQKARHIFDIYGGNCFAEDTGLEVHALEGDPGVHTARYAGLQRNADDNMDLLLNNLKEQTDRDAQFKTVIALFFEKELYCFEGIAKGTIAKEKSGKKGFGYDPIFIPEGFLLTFAELGIEIKNEISHRGKAVTKLIAFLSEIKTEFG